MIILIILLLALSFYRVEYSSWHDDYLSMSSTNAIKGIFAVIILFSHMRGYVTLGEGFIDQGFNKVLNYIGQLMVCLYLFYSGYGIEESLRRKPNYAETFFKKRIIKTLVHFDVAVVLYIILQSMLQNYYSISHYLLSFLGWESVGNSNWFIFDILALYAIVQVLFLLKSLVSISAAQRLVLALALTILLWGALKIGKPGLSWWYDTLITFPLGMFYSSLKPKFEPLCQKTKNYIPILVFLGIVFILWHYRFGVDRYGICASIFCLLSMVITMRMRFDNKILQWLGTHAFAIYIIQRLPMICIQEMGWNENAYLFVTVTIPAVLVVSWGYQKLINLLDNYLILRHICTQGW